ncbi:MAG TPA: protein kinase, partial [Thermoanaerobaculia bacterium]
TDIWSFGCVLFECLTGRPPFGGDTVSDVMARILEREPDWNALPAAGPPRLTDLVRRCLRKDPRERLRDMGDARVVLEEIGRGDTGAVASVPTSASPRGAGGSRGLVLGVALAAAAAGVLGGVFMSSRHRESPRVRKFAIRVPKLEAQFLAPPRISPDGRRIVYRADGRLWVRDLAQYESVPVNDSTGAMQPFWSPDGRKLGFARDGRLWVEDVPGGSAVQICRLVRPESMVTGASWSGNSIVFALFEEAVYQVPSVGGEPRVLLRPDASEEDFHYLEFLPDGRHLVAVAHRKAGPSPVVVVAFPDGGRKNLRAFENLEVLSYSPNGYLLLQFVRSGSKILAAPFSTSRLDFTGEPFPVMPGALFPTAAADGTLSCVLGDAAMRAELVWLDHEGRPVGTVGPALVGATDPAISPDGKSALVAVYENDNSNLWNVDLVHGSRRRVTSGAQDDGSAVWSPDGLRLLYLRTRNVGWDVMESPADGSAAPRRIADGRNAAWGPDGRSVIYSAVQGGKSSLRVQQRAEGSEARHLAGASGNEEDEACLSPDGRWLAYQAGDGSADIFVRRFSDGADRQRVSLEGGDSPFWAKRGEALYYWKGDALMEVPIRVDGGSLRLGTAKKLFSSDSLDLIESSPMQRPPIDIARDGRFLVARRATSDPRVGLLVIEHWSSEYERR